jgi:hypothetical protein
LWTTPADAAPSQRAHPAIPVARPPGSESEVARLSSPWEYVFPRKTTPARRADLEGLTRWRETGARSARASSREGQEKGSGALDGDQGLT